VIGFDATAREFERLARVAAAGRHGYVDLLGRHPKAGMRKVQLVELERVILNGGIAAPSDIAENGANGHLDIRRGIALAVEKCTELMAKIGGAYVEANGHCCCTKFVGPPARCARWISALLAAH
jgi:hypothetical protein